MVKHHLGCLIEDRNGLGVLPLTCKRRSAFFKIVLSISILHSVLEQGLTVVLLFELLDGREAKSIKHISAFPLY